MKRTAFTLLELLIVIAIIAALAALLLPVLATARRHSLSVPCTSNLHQLQLGFRCFRLQDGTYLIIRPPWDFVSDVPCPREQLSLMCGVPEEYVREVECPCGRVHR